VRALYRSAAQRQAVALDPVTRHERPGVRQEIDLPPVGEPGLIDAADPSRAA
jgi:hypothetical protein